MPIAVGATWVAYVDRKLHDCHASKGGLYKDYVEIKPPKLWYSMFSKHSKEVDDEHTVSI